MTEQPTTILGDIEKAVLEGDEVAAESLARAALTAGLPPLTVVGQGCVPGIQQAGQLWEDGEYFLPELITSAQAMKAAMNVLEPELQGQQASAQHGRVVIGTVQGDIHDIGKSLVATMLSVNGFAVHDEGVDVAVERFIDRCRELDADILCASALLTTTMNRQAELATAVREAGLRAKILVGGAPVDQGWADKIGADGYAANAVAAVQVARNLVGTASERRSSDA